eukprot:CAMPEP_0178423904 /NCGR_PEP_ID=MMETSP0689_2-20121128/27928_1 /TAXON_ID=160604 /ORGANISM="Amphidinium massartii, Strain CS-259" /LENGTH=670 /DNA_ID=CAMNT_0020045511 /DNA_START=30 /DNA_END=2039 /DNA_ORIENTATION=-
MRTILQALVLSLCLSTSVALRRTQHSGKMQSAVTTAKAVAAAVATTKAPSAAAVVTKAAPVAAVAAATTKAAPAAAAVAPTKAVAAAATTKALAAAAPATTKAVALAAATTKPAAAAVAAVAATTKAAVAAAAVTTKAVAAAAATTAAAAAKAAVATTTKPALAAAAVSSSKVVPMSPELKKFWAELEALDGVAATTTGKSASAHATTKVSLSEKAAAAGTTTAAAAAAAKVATTTKAAVTTAAGATTTKPATHAVTTTAAAAAAAATTKAVSMLEASAVNLVQMQPDVTRIDVADVEALDGEAETDVTGLSADFLSGDHHVAVRRRLGFALHRAKGSPPPKVLEELKAYAEQYHHEFQSRHAIFFSHVSKSAGTTFCACGMQSGCLGFGMDAESDPVLQNCHARLDDKNAPDDSPHWGGEGQHPPQFDTCSGLVNYAQSNNYTLDGNENYLISEGTCPQFWNVAIFRDPVERLVSHLSELTRIPEKSPWKYREVKVGKAMWNASSITPETVFQELPILSDNFYIRSLLGKDVYHLPFGEITKEHLERAKKVLEGFDLIFLKSDNLLDELHSLMGWACHASRRMGQSDDYSTLLHDSWSQHQWEEVKKQNSLDLALFKHASFLHQLDWQVFHQAVFSAASSQCPTGETQCGFLCKFSPLASVVADRLRKG